MTENEVTTSSTGAAIEPEKKVTKDEETEAPQTPADDDPIKEGSLEKRSLNSPFHFMETRYFVFGTSETKCSPENLRLYYKKTRKTIKPHAPAGAASHGKEDEATTSAAAAATETAGETIQAKNDEPNKVAHRVLCTNIAHATQTGVGLLFYYKSKEHMKEPLGIINLKFVEKVEEVSSGKTDFKIKTENRDYVLKADSESLKKRWIHTILAKVDEAKKFPLPETEEYRSIYGQVSEDRFLKDSGVTSDSENYTSGEDNEPKSRPKYFSFIARKPEKTEKTEKTEKIEKIEEAEKNEKAEKTETTTTTTEITEIVEEGSTGVATTTETTGEKSPERRPSLFHSLFGGKKTEKEKVEVKDSAEETVKAETSTTAEKKEVAKTETAPPEKTETSPTSPTSAQKFSLKKIFFKSPAETKVVESAEQTVITTGETAEETTQTTEETTKAIEETTKVTEEPVTIAEEVIKEVENAVEEAEKVDNVEGEEIKSESSNAKKATAAIFRRVTQVFRRKTMEQASDEIIEEDRGATDVAAGSSAEKEETDEAKKEESSEVTETKKEEIVEEKKPSFFKRISKQQPSQHGEEPETQPATTIESAADATDKEPENLVLKKISTPPRKHGHLDKFTKHMVGVKKYEQRYFVFTHEGALTYYKNERVESNPKEIVISHGSKITKFDDNKHFAFEIETTTHTYRLAAPSEEDRNEWITLLEEHRKSLPETEQSSSSKVQENEEVVVRDVKDVVETAKTEVTEVKDIAAEKVEEITIEKTEIKTEEKIEVKTVEKVEEKTVVITDDKPEETVEVKTEEKITIETSTTAEEKK